MAGGTIERIFIYRDVTCWAVVVGLETKRFKTWAGVLDCLAELGV